ncbi:MAG: hypothetical protein FD149_1021 [Rhodospirillaceae bacterium]|nr:MAG: hypothetical protein FD149_1021 [Rhodospirillaceae bacterium]
MFCLKTDPKWWGLFRPKDHGKSFWSAPKVMEARRQADVRARSILLVFLTVVAVTGLAFAVANREIHRMLFPQENGNEAERTFLGMVAFMLGGA